MSWSDALPGEVPANGGVGADRHGPAGLRRLAGEHGVALP